MVDQETVRLVIFLAVLTERCRDSLALLARICENQALFAPRMLEDIPAAWVRRIWCFVSYGALSVASQRGARISGAGSFFIAPRCDAAVSCCLPTCKANRLSRSCPFSGMAAAGLTCS